MVVTKAAVTSSVHSGSVAAAVARISSPGVVVVVVVTVVSRPQLVTSHVDVVHEPVTVAVGRAVAVHTTRHDVTVLVGSHSQSSPWHSSSGLSLPRHGEGEPVGVSDGGMVTAIVGMGWMVMVELVVTKTGGSGL
ncbi:174d2a38-83b3-40f5-a97e-03be3c3c1ea4 [Thermothielavioides terrestris]|uniref:174d2a38-83b3-40f5-a97e-03be3c3c1ea4 n=1 Tax=Thermothielavioides terrestris TaxID=2587410 RepID=A0A446BRF8_9PEZI|nr:174d2a38-83b3-40f5-a97e-03be3c3c1ea4 [Thermothielavioides terrestris]